MDLRYLPWISIIIGISGIIYLSCITLLSSSKDSPLKKTTNGVFFLFFSLLICLPVTYLLTPISVEVDPKVASKLTRAPEPVKPPKTDPKPKKPEPEKPKLCPDRGYRPSVVGSISEAKSKAEIDRINQEIKSNSKTSARPLGEIRLRDEAKESMTRCGYVAPDHAARSSSQPMTQKEQDRVYNFPHVPVI